MSGRTTTALPYYGGKSVHGPWIAGQLPITDLYIEPYAGMLGVLLRRPPVKIELVNDLNGDIANWWWAVRDDHQALARMVCLTPRSRDHFDEAKEALAKGIEDPLKRAWATHVLLSQCVNAQTEGQNWGRSVSPSVGNPFRLWLADDFAALARRMAKVQIDCVDAVELLRRVAEYEEAVVYCDPPYHTATCAYAHNDVDVKALTDALLAQKGAAAVSGYGEEWAHLGWRVAEKKTVAWSGTKHGERVERLWMNYPPLQADLHQ